jgi:hypothetical protein
MGSARTSKAKRAKDKVKAVAGKFPGAGKVKRLLGEFEAAIPVLKDLGYELSDATIKVAVPPSMVANFEITREVSEEEMNAAAKEHKGEKVLGMVIKMLSRARKVQDNVHVAGLKPSSTGVEIGMFGTGVSVKFA